MGIQKMSIEQRHSVVMKKAQLGSDQCSLTSILPMSCRGRAEAFARRLHTRLRSLGTPSDAAPSANPAPAQDPFYDYDAEYQGPSSPAEEVEVARTSPCHLHDSDCDSLYLDAEEGETHTANFAKYNRLYDGALINNNSKNTANRNDDVASVKAQPSRENGHGDKRLFSSICLDDCSRRSLSPIEGNGTDEVDRGWPSNMSPGSQQFHFPIFVNQPLLMSPPVQKLESHVYFESGFPAASALTNGMQIELEESMIINDVKNAVDEIKEDPTLSNTIEIEVLENSNKDLIEPSVCENAAVEHSPEIVTKEPSVEKETSPEPDGDMSLLHIEDKEKLSSEEENDTNERPQRVRRCSSLKTGKTPPGTPGRKKIVRFADVLGLDLADVKTFMDDIPTVPKSAYVDLVDAEVSAPPPAYPLNGLKKLTDKYIVPMFQPPCILPNFLDILNEKYVCLETATVSEGATIVICGSVRVRNLDFHKSVHIRYTMNGWKTYTDLQAAHIQGSCDGFSDTFHFTLYAPTIRVGQRLEFAVRFQCKGCQYWDNNAGINYCYQCLPFIGNARVNTTAPPLTVHPMENWHPSFY